MRCSNQGKDAICIKTIIIRILFIVLSLFYSTGVLQANFQEDPFLGVYLVGSTPPASGGAVHITNNEDIATHSAGAHGIEAYSSSIGYPSYVINSLVDFREEGFNFEVIEVRDADGQVVDFAMATTVIVHGFLVAVDEHGDAILDEHGNLVPLTDGDGNIVEHGTFVIDKNGTFAPSFSPEEEAAHNALSGDESILTAIQYTVLGKNANDVTAQDTGEFVFMVTADDEGNPETRTLSNFSVYGISLKPSLETNPTIFPDLEDYVYSQLAAITGGGGGAVTINSDGTIQTQGEQRRRWRRRRLVVRRPRLGRSGHRWRQRQSTQRRRNHHRR